MIQLIIYTSILRIIVECFSSLEIPSNLDAAGVEARELLEGTGREVDTARSAAGAKVDNGCVDESALVCMNFCQ